MGKLWPGIRAILILYLLSCSTYEEHDKLERFFKFTTIHNFDDNVLITGATTHASFISDSVIIINDYISRSLTKINLNTMKTSKIGKNGAGPGEYIIPFYFEKDRKGLLLSDFDKPVIEHISFDGEPIATYKRDHHFLNGTKFTVINGGLYVLYDAGSTYFLESETKSYFKVPLCFKEDYPVKSPVGISLSNSTLFFMNLYEAKVYGLETDSDHKFTVNLEHAKAGIWDKHYNEVLSDVKIASILDKSLFSGFDTYLYNEETYFMITETDQRYSRNILYLFNRIGKKVLSVDIGKKKYLSNYKDKFLFLERDENTGMTSFSIYRFDQSTNLKIFSGKERI